MYRDVALYQLSVDPSEERLELLMAENAGLHQRVPGLVSYSLTGTAPGEGPAFVVRTAVSADAATLEDCLRHPLMVQLDADLAPMTITRHQVRTEVDPDSEWYRAMVPDVWLDLAEVVRPHHCALVVIDIQNDFCSPGGVRTSEKSLEMSKRMEQPLIDLVSAARRAGVPVIFTRVVTGEEHDSGPVLARRHRVGLGGAAYTRRGTWGWEICDYLPPQAGDHVIDKATHSAFSTRAMDALLQRLSVTSLVIAGVITNGCVEGTVRDAFGRGYYVVVPEDAVATYDESLQRHSLHNMSRHFGVVATSAEVVSVWRKG